MYTAAYGCKVGYPAGCRIGSVLRPQSVSIDERRELREPVFPGRWIGELLDAEVVVELAARTARRCAADLASYR